MNAKLYLWLIFFFKDRLPRMDLVDTWTDINIHCITLGRSRTHSTEDQVKVSNDRDLDT